MHGNHEEYQKALRISKAIQAHLEEINDDGLRSTDIYPVLARRGLIEKDRHQGLHFRRFLRKLKNNGLLKLIPQCQYRTTSNETLEWYFYRVNKGLVNLPEDINSNKVITPKMPEVEIDRKIVELHEDVKMLPKRNTKLFTPQMLETRKDYPRAYEFWTFEEIRLMKQAFDEFDSIDKVAELLQRQPSAVRQRMEMGC